MRSTYLLLTLLFGGLLAFTDCGANNIIKGMVSNVIDGDTFEVTTKEGDKYRIALLGVECPELTQEFGVTAKLFSEKYLLGKEVVVYLHGRHRTGDYFGTVQIGEEWDLRFSLLEQGLAWTSEKEPLPELESIRLDAVGKNQGLWSQNDPTPPWTYRRSQSMLRPKSR